MGLLRMAARTAVVAGTATAVSGRDRPQAGPQSTTSRQSRSLPAAGPVRTRRRTRHPRTI